MTTPTVIEITRVLEPVARDTFVDAPSHPALARRRPSRPRHRSRGPALRLVGPAGGPAPALTQAA
ncbi:MAG: hypothetical protein QOE11_3506 [Solirubrobacteraceae bacterium]|jgi:hypothetical protein|nr:hypothetical protein [Solirubrobacteraceae bacterium]